jgi:hypothetical protein
MTLPQLYVEGLIQRALLGDARLDTYKLGLIEAVLKEALTADGPEGVDALRSAARTALEVARWEAPRPGRR